MSGVARKFASAHRRAPESHCGVYAAAGDESAQAPFPPLTGPAGGYTIHHGAENGRRRREPPVPVLSCLRDVHVHAMSDPRDDEIHRLLLRLRAGERSAFDELVPLVYDELRHVAGQQRRRWQGDDSLNTTALVHEAYVRLAGAPAPAWQDQPHFLAVAATAMRRILIDYAKRRQSAKRGGGRQRVQLDEIEAALGNGRAADAGDEALLALNDALDRLKAQDERQSRIVECRFFGGMTIDETAAALDVSPITVKRGWAVAQAWLYRELARPAETA